MSEFDGIEGFDGWNRKLRALSDEATTAAQLGDQTARFAVSERLTRFVENSFPNDEKIRALDEIATKMAIGLLEQNVDERLKSIVARNAELARVSKEFDIAAAEANKVASKIRLEGALKTVDALNAGVLAIKELKATLEAGTDEALIESLERALRAAQDVRALLEKS